jgi:hypothetical protein
LTRPVNSQPKQSFHYQLVQLSMQNIPLNLEHFYIDDESVEASKPFLV